MRGPRQLTAAMGALLTALALVLLGAPPSAAGGPTSVLLVSPTSQRTASLYGTHEEYDDLERLLARAGGELDRSREKAPEWGREEIWGERIGGIVSVTWMLHDVTPWRLDRVYTAAPDTKGIWIHTTLLTGEEPSGSPGAGVWHRAKQPDQLRRLLSGLEIVGPTRSDPAPGAPEQDEPPAGDATAGTAGASGTAGAAAEVRSAAGPPGPADGAHWAIPALALGLLLGAGGATALLRRAAARNGSGPPREPRQELLDV
ncbi:hypothetical protein [Streptomyces caniscabiei]|uniref:Secreted protein n=1 Tax=Streptomyces caniscabiei TaxID=2746961 RepID=A0A927L066_9ACTN|nr:hypothetical protein [Streptomyces caniscabiei]MBD9723062.1 hypothetical protein [Streptomyces caniscabiei]MDX3508317.1 hypothetical protein [Streptomyces caniscabiei]MDX3719486.1 hypothetical protein [Streptomyces caniscabiei]WEO24701.1 hypothetical protein IHE65_16795 [Streptomyces caniscabiei]